MTRFGTVSAWAALAMGALFGVNAYFQFATGVAASQPRWDCLSADFARFGECRADCACWPAHGDLRRA
jgi:hypothetical protein